MNSILLFLVLILGVSIQDVTAQNSTLPINPQEVAALRVFYKRCYAVIPDWFWEQVANNQSVYCTPGELFVHCRVQPSQDHPGYSTLIYFNVEALNCSVSTAVKDLAAGLTNLQAFEMTIFSNQEFPTSLSNLTNFTSLRITGDFNLTDAFRAGFPSLAALHLSQTVGDVCSYALGRLTALKELVMDPYNRCESNVQVDMPASLESLSIHNSRASFPRIDTLVNLTNISLSTNIDQQPLPALPVSTQYVTIQNTHIVGNFYDTCYPNLISLDLSWNSLTGTVPSCLVGPKLVYLSLSSNQLSGTLSDDFFANAFSLKSFDISNNYITGTLPESIHALRVNQINYFDISSNPFTPWTLTDELATTIGAWIDNNDGGYGRFYVGLSDVNLYGTVPESWVALCKRAPDWSIDLGGNDFINAEALNGGGCLWSP